MSKEFNLGKLLKIIIAVLTALAGAIGVASCTAKNDNVNADARGASVATTAGLSAQRRLLATLAKTSSGVSTEDSQLMAHRS